MIALDNGPANGDYVRYIEQLIAATRTTATGSQASAPMSSPTFVPMPNMSTVPGQVPSARTTAPMTPTAANAIAQAMITRSSLPKPSFDTAIPRGLAGVLIGIALIAFGFFSDPVRVFLVVIGLFALGSGARTLTRSVGARIVTAG